MAGGRRRLKQALDHSLSKKQDKLKLIPAMCGAYLNGQKTLQVSGRDDYIWVRMRGSTSEVVRAFNDAVTPHWDLPILIYRDPNAPDVWKVYGRDITRYEDWGNVSYLPRHAGQHSFAHGDYGSDVVWVYKRQFMPMLSHPQATAAMSIYIDPDFYHWEGSYAWWPGSGTVDMSSYKPTGANNAKFVTVALDGYTGNLLYVEGPEFDAIWVPTNPAEFIPAPTPSQGIPIVSILLMTGTSSIGWAELYDVRNIISPLLSFGASGTITPPQISQYDGCFTFPCLYVDDGTGAARVMELNDGLIHVTNRSTGFDDEITIRGNYVILQGNGGFEAWRLSPAESVFNENGLDFDTRAESASGTHSLFVRGSDGRIGINTSSPEEQLAVEAPTRPAFALKHSGGSHYLRLGQIVDDVRADLTSNIWFDGSVFDIDVPGDGWAIYTQGEASHLFYADISVSGTVATADVAAAIKLDISTQRVAVKNVPLQLDEISKPSDPAAGMVYIYSKTDKKLYLLDSDGTETDLTQGGAGGGADILEVQVFS